MRIQGVFAGVVLTGLAVAAGVFFWLDRPREDDAVIVFPEDVAVGAAESDTASAVLAPWFEDVTAASAVNFGYRNGEEADYFTILESLGGGVALIDFDGDGLLDIYATGGGTLVSREESGIRGLAGGLFKNLGNFHFSDVTQQAGLQEELFYSHGALVTDPNNDGLPDLLITGYGGIALYRNEGGGHFRNAARELQLTDSRWSTSAAAGDLFGNGRADIFVCRYVNWSFSNDPLCLPRGQSAGRDVCPPQSFNAIPSSLFRNDGQSFTDLWETLQPVTAGKALGTVIADLNADGRPDVYVANDAGANWLFLNQGGGKFIESATVLGAAVDDSGRYNGSMGVDVGDYDGSGRASLWVTNFESELPALYRNTGAAGYAYSSQAAGLGVTGGRNVGFGTAFIDPDHNGWLDIVFVNGHVVRQPVGSKFRQRPVLLRNIDRSGRRVFTDVTEAGGDWFFEPALGRGLAVGDLDNDGHLDLVVSRINQPLSILKGTGKAAVDNKWIGLQLEGRGHRPLAGAVVSIEAGGRTFTHFVRSGASYLSSGDPRVLAGLGATVTSDQVDSVTVRWPWGKLEKWTNLKTGRYWLLRESDSEPIEPIEASGNPIR